MLINKKKKVIKTDKHLTDGMDLYDDVHRWHKLYISHLMRSVSSGEISLHTMTSYRWTVDKFLEFITSNIRGYDSIRDMDSELLNEYLIWLQSYDFNARYGDLDYQASLISDFVSYLSSISPFIDDYHHLLQYVDDFIYKIGENGSVHDADIIERVLEHAEYDGKRLANAKENYIVNYITIMEQRRAVATNKTMRQRRSALSRFIRYVEDENDEQYRFIGLIEKVDHYKGVNETNDNKGLRNRYLGFDEKEAIEVVKAIREYPSIHADDLRREQKLSYSIAMRDSFLALVMLYGGLRASEVRALRPMDIVEDTDPALYKLTINRAKGKKSRTAYIRRVHIQALKEFMDDSLMGAFYSSTRSGNMITHQQLARNIKRIFVHYKIERSGTHVFRHHFASQVARKSKNIAVLQKLLDHASPNTTQIYIDVLEEDKKSVILESM